MKKKKKTILTQEDLKLGPTELSKKYSLSGRGHAWNVLKQGYFWENCHVIEESLSPNWVEKNLSEITKAVNFAVFFKTKQKGILSHRLFKEFKKDLFQEGLLYVILRAGEIESGKSKLRNIAKTGVDHVIMKLFFARDGKNNIGENKFCLSGNEKSRIMADPDHDEEMNLDEFYLNIKDLISSIDEKKWEKVWDWALSRKTKCPEDVRTILEEVSL
jgi:hypothetical protein